MYCGVGALFLCAYPWVSKLLKVKHLSQRVQVRTHGKDPGIDFLSSNFCVGCCHGEELPILFFSNRYARADESGQYMVTICKGP